MFADVESLLVVYLASTPGVTGVSVDLPPNVRTRLPFIQVNRVGGSDDYVTDSATVDVDAFHATRAEANTLARVVHAAMMRLRHTAVDGVLVDSVETITGPMWVSYEDENLQRYVATYQIDSRVCAAP